MKRVGGVSERVAGAIAEALIARPGLFVTAILLLVAFSAWSASRLGLNTNQLDLIDQDLRAVKDVKRVVEMVGGAGHLILALRGSDEKKLKQTADDIVRWLEQSGKIHHVNYKIDTTFVRKNALLFMDTQDLLEVRKRVTAYLKDRIKRASPFFFEIKKTEPVKLQVDDIIDKYKKIGKKAITDDYWISDDKELLIISIKPKWNSTELEKTGKFVEQMRKLFANWEKSKFNTAGTRLVEDYTKDPPKDPNTIEYGFTGSYQLSYDESYEIKKSLAPVSGIALAGVFAILLLFFGRRFGAIFLVLTGLLFGVTCSFGFAYWAVGELNMVTSILAGILMGLGIDFGIHLIYRLREELGAHGDLPDAVRAALIHQGPASFVSAAGIGAAFLSLLLSEFKGFSQFGLLSGVGVFIIGLVIYLWVPSVLLLLERWKPGAAASLIGTLVSESRDDAHDRIPRPGLLLFGGLAVALGLSAFAGRAEFDYNTRTLSVSGQPSLVLHDEISERFDISSDPVAVYTPDAESARKVYEALKRRKDELTMVDQVVSVYSFIPPAEQQQRNYEIAQDWLKELEAIDPSVLPPEYQARWQEALEYLKAKPYSLEKGLPQYIIDQFHLTDHPDPKYRGWLTFIYPNPGLWNGKKIIEFAEQVENIPVEGGEVYHAAGLPILYALLAKIVLSDAKTTVALTALLLVLILLIDLRSLVATLVALLPLLLGMGMMLGLMGIFGWKLNFVNIVVLPIVLGYGVSHGVYLIHRFQEGTSPRRALRSVGRAVASSTLTTLAGWAALLAAPHGGLRSMGMLACLGMSTTLIVSFTVMPAVLQLLHDRRGRANGSTEQSEKVRDAAA
ncbi:MAG: export protein [Deltaproteobacteria bacterium]|nr:MAG: export protein [Deltaproteobacteria bacterium]